MFWQASCAVVMADVLELELPIELSDEFELDELVLELLLVKLLLLDEGLVIPSEPPPHPEISKTTVNKNKYWVLLFKLFGFWF